MTTTRSTEQLGIQIERLVEEHLAASHRAAAAAVERAFASARRGRPKRSHGAAKGSTASRRPPAEVAALGERLYEAVCANPGEGMKVLAADVGETARDLHRPMALLKRAGRVRSVGQRQFTRYFPMATSTSETA